MNLRAKIKKLIYEDWNNIESVKSKEKLVDAILEAVREMVPEEKKPKTDIIDYLDGWNSCRSEFLKRLKEN